LTIISKKLVINHSCPGIHTTLVMLSLMLEVRGHTTSAHLRKHVTKSAIIAPVEQYSNLGSFLPRKPIVI